jgi:hypothetical protein
MEVHTKLTFKTIAKATLCAVNCSALKPRNISGVSLTTHQNRLMKFNLYGLNFRVCYNLQGHATFVNQDDYINPSLFDEALKAISDPVNFTNSFEKGSRFFQVFPTFRTPLGRRVGIDRNLVSPDAIQEFPDVKFRLFLESIYPRRLILRVETGEPLPPGAENNEIL